MADDLSIPEKRCLLFTGKDKITGKVKCIPLICDPNTIRENISRYMKMLSRQFDNVDTLIIWCDEINSPDDPDSPNSQYR